MVFGGGFGVAAGGLQAGVAEEVGDDHQVGTSTGAGTRRRRRLLAGRPERLA